MTAAVLDRPLSECAPLGGRTTLVELLESAFRDARADGSAKCPVCDARLTLAGDAAECPGCGSRLS